MSSVCLLRDGARCAFKTDVVRCYAVAISFNSSVFWLRRDSALRCLAALFLGSVVVVFSLFGFSGVSLPTVFQESCGSRSGSSNDAGTTLESTPSLLLWGFVMVSSAVAMKCAFCSGSSATQCRHLCWWAPLGRRPAVGGSQTYDAVACLATLVRTLFCTSSMNVLCWCSKDRDCSGQRCF